MGRWLDFAWTPGFMPHGHCYLWRPDILWLHVISDAVIAASYFVIPIALVQLVRRRKDLAFDWVFLLFAAFIFCCGMTHAWSIWTVWEPFYRAEGLLKLATASVSLGTAFVVWPLLPRVVALPSTRELEEANARYRTLSEDLEERVRDRTALLETRNADLERFASFLSHELRQPLNTILLNAELLLSDDSPPALRRSVERIRRGAHQMSSMIDAELELVRVTGNETVERVALEELVRDVVRELHETGATGVFRISPLPRVIGHAAQLRQVFRNLLSNSIRYARPGVPLEVVIDARTDGRFVRIEVRDNGQGFDDELGQGLFASYARTASPEEGGHGIGLALCERIVARHGGRIRAKGCPGQGATFWIDLPYVADAVGDR
ncbi:MAG: HAMP domain-containing sensor histidine kinase [Myxococcota bacterium]